MPRFFIDYTPEVGSEAVIVGADARHIGGALRMTPGESLTLCDGCGTDYACTVTEVEKERVTLSVDAATPSSSEPSLAVTLYMGLPKGDKMELIIQKCVELGVTAIVPVSTSRCIVKLDGKDAAKKQVRWQKIAAEAAGQSGRGIIPAVETPILWKTALSRFETERTLLCYEGGGAPIGQLVTPADTAVSLVVGPEGGFDVAEVEAVLGVGGNIATLGPRILRCETAPLAAIAVLMEKSGNME